MGSGGRSYALFLFTGLVAWGLFAAMINLSMSSLRESGSLLRKVAFPAWAPVLGAGLVQLIQVGLESIVLLVWFVFVGNSAWSWLYAPFIVLGMACFAQGVGLALATLNARFGDVEYIVSVVLAALYFLTPVLYPASQVPGGAAGGWGHRRDRSRRSRWYVALAARLALQPTTVPARWRPSVWCVFGLGVADLGSVDLRADDEDVGELL